MNNPWLTIITVTKNDALGLARTLGSAAGLRAAGAEHLVVDGGDDAVATAQMVTQTPGIVSVYAQRPQGIADAFNAGLAQAQGEWIWFLNGGDTIHEGLDSDWLLTLLKQTQAEAVTGAIHYDGDALPRAAPPLRMQWPPITSWLPHPATLVRRAVLQQLGGFDVRWKICMDFDLWYRLLARTTRVDVVAMPLARFDTTGLSQSSENRRQLLRENVRVLWKYQGLIWRTCWQKGWHLLYVFLHAAKNIWF